MLALVPVTSGFTHHRLAALAHAGDSPAMEALLSAYQPLLSAEARRLRVPGMEVEDLLQIGRLALARCAAAYDPARGPLGALAKLAVRRSLATELERMTRRCRVPSGLVLSLEELTEGPEDREPEAAEPFEPTAVDRLHHQSLAAEAFARTPDAIDQAILEGTSEGASLTDIARHVGLSPQALGRRRERLLARLKAEMEAAGWSA